MDTREFEELRSNGLTDERLAIGEVRFADPCPPAYEIGDSLQLTCEHFVRGSRFLVGEIGTVVDVIQVSGPTKARTDYMLKFAGGKVELGPARCAKCDIRVSEEDVDKSWD